MANDAAEQSRKLTLPKTAEAYEMKLPADFKMPEGVTFEFNKGDGAIAQAQAFALKNGLTQDQFSELAGIYAGNRAGELATFNTAKTAELAKLGGAGTARITAVQTWLTAMGGPEAAALVRVLEYAPVAGTIVAMENLMKKFSSQGGADFSQAHREGAADPAVIPGYDTMSFTQRRAAQMSQKAAK